MGNQQPKEKAVVSINIFDGRVQNDDLFTSNDDIGISSDSWRPNTSMSTTKIETKSLSSFTSTDAKNAFVIAQSDFISARPYSHITVKKGEKLKFKGYSPDGLWVNVKRLDGKDNGWIPTNIVGEVMKEDDNTESSLSQFSWYHGAVQRSFAEYLLNSGINGSFLVRESETNSKLRSISLRYDGKIWHFRISKDLNKKYYVMETQRFNSIQLLIEYHSKYADTLPCQLLYAAPRRAKATVFGVAESDSSDNWEIDRTEILMKDQLGGGQYGIVYEGYWQRHNITVAVKTVKADITVTDDFLEEARLMKSLQHPNLVRLLGVCTREPPNYIITEFMENGNLLDYLRTRPKDELSPPVLLYMAIQISAGMEYLEERNFIHRDLAARNCLVGQDNIVKVADFGLARCMERDDTYTAHVGAKFPIKWTAPEGLAYNIFSTKSDVWAFGILLWELATYGMTPYPGIELQDVYVYLQNDNLMHRPSGCPDNVYELMKKCWKWQPENRPTFKDLHTELEEMLSNINEQVDLEMAKEKDILHNVLKNPNCSNDLLPNLSNQTLPLSQSITKRKEAPVPPMRTTTLKDMSLTSSFIHYNRSLSTVDDDFLPLPPPEKSVSNKVNGSFQNELSQRISSNLPPPTSKNKPKHIEASEFSSPSVIDNSFLKNHSNFKQIITEKTGNVICPTVQKVATVPKPAPRNQQAFIEEAVKRARSDLYDNSRPGEHDFRSELKSRLKMQQKDDDTSTNIDEKLKEDNQYKGNAAWQTRKSMGHMLNTNNTAAFTDNVIAKNSNILVPSNKRMSWTGPASTLHVPGKKSVNLTPLPSLSSSSLCLEEDETDIDDFITKDNLIGEFNSLCHEIVNLKSKIIDQNSDGINSMVERLETVHLGSTRYYNSSINSAKIKFKFIEKCANLHSGIGNLRKSLKPYEQTSVLVAANGIRTSLLDLKTLIESNN